MCPRSCCRRTSAYDLNEGKDITLVPGLKQLREDVFETLDYDTVVVLDSHWATTVEFVITAQARSAAASSRREELPRGMSQMPYDFKGDPELAQLSSRARTRRTAPGSPRSTTRTCRSSTRPSTSGTTSARGSRQALGQRVRLPDGDDRGLPAGRPRARRGHPRQRPQGAPARLRRAVAHLLQAARPAQARGSDPSHIFSPEAREADHERIEWMKQGDHARILETMPEFKKVQARGERSATGCSWPAPSAKTPAPRQAIMYSEYENSIGTGQVHVWFPRTRGWVPAAQGRHARRRFRRQRVAEWERVTEYRRILLDGGRTQVTRTATCSSPPTAARSRSRMRCTCRRRSRRRSSPCT